MFILLQIFLTVPSVAPQWTIIQRTSAMVIELEWMQLTLEESRGFITGYNIRYTESVHTCLLISDEFIIVTDNNHLLLNELNPRLEYCIIISAITSIGNGVYSQWMLVQGRLYNDIQLFIVVSSFCLSCHSL